MFRPLLIGLIPVSLLCFGILLARDYGWPVICRMIAYMLLKEADRSEKNQAKNHDEIRRRLEEVA